MSASEANAKAAQAALELQEAQVVRSQAERVKTLKSEKDMKEEMEAQQLGYKLWTIDTSIDPKKKTSLISKEHLQHTKTGRWFNGPESLEQSGSKRSRSKPAIVSCLCLRSFPRFAVLKTELSSRQESVCMMPRAIAMRFVFVHLFPQVKWFSMPQIFGYPWCIIAPVDLWQELTSMLEVPKLAMGYIDPSWFQVVFWSFQKLGIRSC